MLTMNAPHAPSRFLLIPQVADASTMAKGPVLRRYSLARLASPALPPRRSHPAHTAP
jgi:hypothetical protein